MKFSATKERARDRREYVYMHREFLNRDPPSLICKLMLQKPVRDFIAQTRLDLGYSEKTASVDIWLSLQRTLKAVTK